MNEKTIQENERLKIDLSQARNLLAYKNRDIDALQKELRIFKEIADSCNCDKHES